MAFASPPLLHGTDLLRAFPRKFTFAGDAKLTAVSPSESEPASPGILLRLSAQEISAASVKIPLPDPTHRWFRFGIRALASESFSQPAHRVVLRASFSARDGTTPLDSVTRHLQTLIATDLTNLRDPGTNRSLGTPTWRWYALDFKTPFPEVDTVSLSLELSQPEGAELGNVTGTLLVCDWELTPLPTPPPAKDFPERSTITAARSSEMIPLGGRWYVLPEGTAQTVPETFSQSNAHRLLYLAENFETPFLGNMDAWLKQGQLDR
jgi:hypothetical protein